MEKDASFRPSPAAWLLAAACLGLIVQGCSSTSPSRTSTPPPANRHAELGTARLVILNANVITMNDAQPIAQAVAVDAAGKIMKVGSTLEIMPLASSSTQRIDGTGMTILPGFIDPHSHMAGYGMYNDPDHWTDVSSINVYFKPAPGSRACLTPNDPQHCFIPVQTQEDVLARLRAAVAKAKLNTPPSIVLAFNYDPSRLGRGVGCEAGKLSFQCMTFEDGKALEQLNAISRDVPIYVTSESGHISYVNSAALAAVHVCGTFGRTRERGCHQPTINPSVEIALANQGQLDEDLSLYATGYFQGKLLQANPGLGPKLLQRAAEIYAAHGYTLAQEGAAGVGDMSLYRQVTKDCQRPSCAFPLSVGLLAYDNDSPDFAMTIAAAEAGKKMFSDTPLVFVAALKTFADGSPQGYTAFLDTPYHETFEPFTNRKIFDQPYRGLPDIKQPELEKRLRAAHAAGYPMVIHQIGDAAIGNVVRAVVATQDSPPPAGKRDVMLHAPMISDDDLDQLKPLGTAVVSIMSSNVYFFGLPECHMVLGPKRTINFYPARSVRDHDLHLTLHSDSPVMPPYPLFETWVAVTRNIQQPAWYPNTSPDTCPTTFANAPNVPGDQRINILDGIKAFTTNAAWQYGFTDRGSLRENYVADMVLLSANPLDPKIVADPGQLKTIRMLGTISYGQYFKNPEGDVQPVWPD